ncbi:MAG: phosphatase PAP2 family protein [Solirubrobacteraceae bacterium]
MTRVSLVTWPRSGKVHCRLHQLHQADAALYAAVARTGTPALDRSMARLSDAANYSRLSIASAAVLGAVGGARGRRAARYGLASVTVTATIVNLAIKPLTSRRRPDRMAEGVPRDRHVRMPVSTSFPSGHSAAAFAFATGVGHVMPVAAIPLRLLATAVAYSRVHTGVHYPGDVVAGSLIGVTLAQVTNRALDRR